MIPFLCVLFMMPMMNENSTHSFKILFDTYSPMLYGIATEISMDSTEADNLLTAVFDKVYKLKIHLHEHTSTCVALIQLLIQTAHERSNKSTANSILKLKQFESTPILHKVLCEQVNLEHFCKVANLTSRDVILQIREEFKSMSMHQDSPAQRQFA